MIVREMLNKIKFIVFWPKDWEDVGPTERPMWANSYGYGYYYCDEPCVFVELGHMDKHEIAELKGMINNATLSIDDIPDDIVSYFDNDITKEELIRMLQDFNKLPDEDLGEVYCAQSINFEFQFFTSLEEMRATFDRGDNFNGGKYWDELSDEELTIWADRLFNQNLDFELPIE